MPTGGQVPVGPAWPVMCEPAIRGNRRVEGPGDGLMGVVLRFGSNQAEFEIPSEIAVQTFRGPEGVTGAEARQLVSQALERPVGGYPPLRQAIVAGDQVTIALDPRAPEIPATLGAIFEVLEGAGVEPGSVQVVCDSAPPTGWLLGLPPGLKLTIHDPEDREELAYLASTESGRRVYLNRALVDADAVVAVGRLGFDAVMGYRGPWSVIDPALADREARLDDRTRGLEAADEPPDQREALKLSAGVSWLLGSAFQVGLLEGSAGGVATAIAGSEAEVRAAAVTALAEHWTAELDGPTDLVVAGIGRPGASATWDDLASALAVCTPLVGTGGRLAILSDLAEPPGLAVGRLLGIDDPAVARKALRGLDAEPDAIAARRIARATSDLRIYLLSRLPADLVEDLNLVPLADPEEAGRLVAAAKSCRFIERAECWRIVSAGADP